MHNVIHLCGQCEANQTGEKKVTHSNCFHCHCWMSGILQEHNGANETQSHQQCCHSENLDIICEIIVISTKRGQHTHTHTKLYFYTSVIEKGKKKAEVSSGCSSHALTVLEEVVLEASNSNIKCFL